MTTSSETIKLSDLDQCITLLMDWHFRKVEIVKHMLSVPSGTEMEREDGTKHILEGEFLLGFKEGLNLALIELGSLPFVAEFEQENTNANP